MKPILVGLAVLAASTSTALANPHATPNKRAHVHKRNYGEGYDPLKPRSARHPRVADTPSVRPVIESERAHANGRSLYDKVRDVEYCWLRVPARRRVATSATLHVTVEPMGNVSSVRVDGELPRGVARCMSKVGSRWRFAVADTRSELEQAIMLTTH